VHIVEPGFFKTPLLDATASRKRLAEKLKKLPDVYKADLPPDIEEKSKQPNFTLIRKLNSDYIADGIAQVPPRLTQSVGH